MTFGADDPCPSCTCTGHEYDKLDILRQLVLLACAQVLAVCSYDRINTDHLEDMAAGLGEDSSMPAGCLQQNLNCSGFSKEGVAECMIST